MVVTVSEQLVRMRVASLTTKRQDGRMHGVTGHKRNRDRVFDRGGKLYA